MEKFNSNLYTAKQKEIENALKKLNSLYTENNEKFKRLSSSSVWDGDTSEYFSSVLYKDLNDKIETYNEISKSIQKYMNKVYDDWSKM